MPIKLTSTTEVGKIGGKKIQRNKQKSKHRNKKCFSWVTAIRVLSLARSHSPPHLPRMPSNVVPISGPVVGAAQILTMYSCLQCPQLSEWVRFCCCCYCLFVLFCFFWWELSMAFYIFHSHRVCLVDCVDLIWSLYSWWEGFGSSSLARLSLGFNCGFIFTCLWVVHWSLLLRLPWRTWVCRCEIQVWRWCSCLGRRGSGSTRFSRELAAMTAGNIVL